MNQGLWLSAGKYSGICFSFPPISHCSLGFQKQLTLEQRGGGGLLGAPLPPNKKFAYNFRLPQTVVIPLFISRGLVPGPPADTKIESSSPLYKMA